MDWIPITFIAFKVIVLGIGMFFAVKWHYDQDRKAAKGNALHIAKTVSAVLVPFLLILMAVTFALVRTLDLELLPL